MPPKKKFSREQIIDAAFEIAQAEGLDAITIRKVADKLGSSIAPIYVNFNEAEELVKEVFKRIVQLSQEILAEQNSGNPFRDIGVASLRFAREYGVLFMDLTTKQGKYMEAYNQDMVPILITQMKEDPELSQFTDKELMGILFKMRVFTLGLSTMVANRLLPEEFTEKRILQLMDQTAMDIVAASHLRKRGEL